MRTDTKEKIIAYLQQTGKASAKDIVEHLGITRQALFKHLPVLLIEKKIMKVGRPPRVYYSLLQQEKDVFKGEVSVPIKKVINDRYLYISPSGARMPGWAGFVEWSQKTKQDPIKTASEYLATLKKYDRFVKNGLIDGTEKLKQTFDEVFVDKLHYLDFYSIERFGKTKLGQMLLYAKQSQDKKLIREVSEVVREKIEHIIKKHAIDGIAFIPPTVRREVQFMKELEKHLHLQVRIIKVDKIRTTIVVPQKTLTKLSDRIENARQTIAVRDKGQYKNILIIDDAVGSGATLNETAGQIKNMRLSKGKIIAVSITGSFKGFDVISEV